MKYFVVVRDTYEFLEEFESKESLEEAIEDLAADANHLLKDLTIVEGTTFTLSGGKYIWKKEK